VLGLQGAVDNQQVAAENAEAGHGIPLGTGEEGGRRMFHQVVVNIQRGFHKVVRRAGKAGAHCRGEQRQGIGRHIGRRFQGGGFHAVKILYI